MNKGNVSPIPVTKTRPRRGGRGRQGELIGAARRPFRLARSIRAQFDADWGLAETGAAGPTGNPYGDEAGHSCLAVSGPVELVITLETGQAERAGNMTAFAEAALNLLRRALTHG